MKKIGFIDYFLDEWHANNYPKMIKEQSNGEYEVCYAWAKIDSPIGGMTSKEWSEKYNIELLDTMEEVIEKSDVLIVLSPNNPEMHEELCLLPLRSGKRVYIDKTNGIFNNMINLYEMEFCHGRSSTCFIRYDFIFRSAISDFHQTRIL